MSSKYVFKKNLMWSYSLVIVAKLLDVVKGGWYYVFYFKYWRVTVDDFVKGQQDNQRINDVLSRALDFGL